MLGSLQDVGNTTTLANYLETLRESKLLAGLQKYSVDKSRKYRSIPKLQVFNNALLTATSDAVSFSKVLSDTTKWGRWVESSVGSYLLDVADRLESQLYYWRENNEEVDFVLTRGEKTLAIEVKSGRNMTNTGMSVFIQKFHPTHSLVVGTRPGAMPIEQLYTGDLSTLL